MNRGAAVAGIPVRQALIRWLQRPDPEYARLQGRIHRLAMVSSVALGLIWWLAYSRGDVDTLVSAGLLAGWALMPVVLVASLKVTGLKYLLVLPATLVTCSLVVISVAKFPSVGWLLLTSGIALGGLMGASFWFRWTPIPRALKAEYSRGRIVLIVIHVAMILGGAALVALSS